MNPSSDPHSNAHGSDSHHAHHGESTGTVKDPVCGMLVNPATARGKHVHSGETYFFCSPHCLERFQADPAKYVSQFVLQRPAVQAASPVAAEFVCPMHPEIVRSEPGDCPICGMALEPRTAAVGEEVSPELTDMTRRFWVSLTLTTPVFLLAMSDMIPGQPVQQVLSGHALRWVEFVLATPVVLWGGWPFLTRGWTSIVNRRRRSNRLGRASASS